MISDLIRRSIIKRKIRDLRKSNPKKWMLVNTIIPRLITKPQPAGNLTFQMIEVPEEILERARDTQRMLARFGWNLSDIDCAEISYAIATDKIYTADYVACHYKIRNVIFANDRLVT